MTHQPVVADLPDPSRPSNRMASVALTLGVLSFFGGVTAIPGVICGILGWRAAKKFGGEGRTTAIAGIGLSLGSLVLVGLGMYLMVREGVG